MRTALHLACMHEHNSVALELASHDPSTLDAFDNVSAALHPGLCAWTQPWV